MITRYGEQGVNEVNGGRTLAASTIASKTRHV